jgi:hypothetical protein
MPLFSIIVVNTTPGCDTKIEQQVDVTGCSSYLVRLTTNSDAVGPFNVYVGTTGSTPYYSAVTKTQMTIGVVVALGCTPTPTTTNTQTPTQTSTIGSTPNQTPTNTGTPTQTPTNTQTTTPTSTIGSTPNQTPTNTGTPTQTPTNTQTKTPTQTNTGTPTQTPTNTRTPNQTPTQTPTNTRTLTPTPTSSAASFFAYLFPEPLDSVSQIDLGQYMYDSGADWYGFGNTGVPSTSNYNTNMNYYVQYSGWTGSSGNFITPVTSLKSPIKQSAGYGTDGFGCSQNQFTFGTIQVTTSQVNPSAQYFYTVWIPLAGVGGAMSNMTIDLGLGSVCSTSIVNDGIPDSVLASTSVTVSGALIPDGTYRVLWMSPLTQIPTSIPLTQFIYFKGNTKT